MESKIILCLPRGIVENILDFATYCSVCKVIGQQEKYTFNYTWCSLYKCDGCERLYCDYCNHEDLVKCCCVDQCGSFCVPRTEQWVTNKIASYMIKFGAWDREGNALQKTLARREINEIVECIRMKAHMSFGETSDTYKFIDGLVVEYKKQMKKSKFKVK